jgi:hypothetical protein
VKQTQEFTRKMRAWTPSRLPARGQRYLLAASLRLKCELVVTPGGLKNVEVKGGISPALIGFRTQSGNSHLPLGRGIVAGMPVEGLESCLGRGARGSIWSRVAAL